MQAGKFKEVRAYKDNEKWSNLIKRYGDLYSRKDDIRSEFLRDYNRILHCTAYRRLKHKTQVFFAAGHDHICTRIEHVNHVAAVSYTISKFLGLNTELTNAIAIGHDLGHTPFGHEGEQVIKKIMKRDLNKNFWHEKNSLKFVDEIEILSDPNGKEKNLNLTYAVRDGIVSHCGEVNENAIFPRNEYLNLESIEGPNEYEPYTWEGCVVKISDKISYLGRDIEDALTLNILSQKQIDELLEIVRKVCIVSKNESIESINNTVLIHNFTIDLCKSSSPQEGICFSNKYLELINSIKEFNYKYIYNHKRLKYFKNYAKLIIESIYDFLSGFYSNNSYEIFNKLELNLNEYTCLINSFRDWLVKYSFDNGSLKRSDKYENTIIYRLSNKNDYLMAVIDYITGMTDNFAIKIFEELIKFE